jgi:exo-beta-1,3-glucanase (GH17 family)/cellulose synthase/poly-beta-1,6-N-acetylglucosamine synthase-like glycosyltransferase
MGKPRTLVSALLMAALSCALWIDLNQPRDAPPWPDMIQGLSFSPVRDGENPNHKIYPTRREIEEDIARLQRSVIALRTYTVEDVFADIPSLARRHGINVTVGAWISDDPVRNESEINRVIEVARKNKNVVRVIVGNESLLRGDILPVELIRYLDLVRRKTRVPVSTAEPWNVWLDHPELAAHVDFVAAHVLPYWEGIPVERAVEFVAQRHDQLQAAFPHLPIVLAEVGWPSKGRTRHGAVASPINQALFLREFVSLATREGYVYYLMEAFDQPWKRSFEGDVGAYWGIYDAERRPKFPFRGPLFPVPDWPVPATIGAALAFLAYRLLMSDGRRLKIQGRGFLGAIALALATSVVWLVRDYSHQYWTATSIAVGILMTLSLFIVAAVVLTEAHEWAEARWIDKRRRLFSPLAVRLGPAPKVSIHVPTFNEPPAMVIATLDALSRLEYADYEVIVIDNNTEDPALWRPVEAHCLALGQRFRFFHVDRLAGYKAGALNFALNRTASDAPIVAVVDSDYQVSPDWLSKLVPAFSDPKVAIVQAPQDYRDGRQSLFKSMCYQEYRGFFRIGMVTRNDRNAIIQHGTMTLVRRRVLDEVGGWGEWCITEDAELGLRVFAKGYEALYTPESFGVGVTPDTFLDYKKQRYRWVYGAMQIMRAHAGALFHPAAKGLTLGQRYHFIAGWLPWMADGLNLFFTLAAIAWATAILIDPEHIDPALAIFVVPPLVLFGFKVGKLAHLYRGVVGAGWRDTMFAALAGLSLSHTIAKAAILGWCTRNHPFICTPKMRSTSPLLRALAAVQEEAVLMLSLWFLALGVSRLEGFDAADVRLWVAMMFVQSLPYFAAVITAIISALPRAAALESDTPAAMPVAETR